MITTMNTSLDIIKGEKIGVAAFDFHAAMTHHHTLIPFLTYWLGPQVVARHLFGMTPLIASVLWGKHPRDLFERRLFRRIFPGEKTADWEDAGNKFARRLMPAYVRPRSLARLEWHRKQRHTTVLVSGAPSVYMRAAAVALGFDVLICPELETKGDTYTGEIVGCDRPGAEKARCLAVVLREIRERGIATELFAYGDAEGDKPLLEMADHAFYQVL